MLISAHRPAIREARRPTPSSERCSIPRADTPLTREEIAVVPASDYDCLVTLDFRLRRERRVRLRTIAQTSVSMLFIAKEDGDEVGPVIGITGLGSSTIAAKDRGEDRPM